jgi:hypothetical protein
MKDINDMQLHELHNLLSEVSRKLYSETLAAWDEPLRAELTKYAEKQGLDPEETYRLDLLDKAYFNDSRAGEAVYGTSNFVERIQRDVAVALLRKHRFN